MEKDTANMVVDGIPMRVTDVKGSIVRGEVKATIEQDVYKLNRIPFEDGDIVIDVGANIGMVTIYLALKHPGIKIVAIEPFPVNFENLVHNLNENHLPRDRVVPLQVALGRKVGALDMVGHPQSNSGGATGHVHDVEMPDHVTHTATMTTLNRMIEDLNKQKIRLLKIDCEGAEYDVLKNCIYLDKIEYLSGEFHVNGLIIQKHGGPWSLINHIKRHIPVDNIAIEVSRMAE